MNHFKKLLCLALAAAPLTAGSLSAVPLGTAFNYQGRLDQNNQPATNGIFSMRFAIYDAGTGGTVLGTNLLAVPVTNGLFNATLDYGIPPFLFGDAAWLEIGVSPDRVSPSPSYTLLSPRTRLTPTPFANYSSVAGLARNVTNGAVHADGLSTAVRPTTGQVLSYDGSALVWQNPAAVSGAWVTGGNTAAAGNFLGTVNNLPLDLRANNTRALRLEPNATSPNVIGGFGGNYASNGVVGAFIGGGGAETLFGVNSQSNRVFDGFGTLCGGASNTVGSANGDPGDAFYSFLGGGYGNTANGYASTVGAGAYNRASGNGSLVGGGWNNNATELRSTIAGGFANTNQGVWGTIGGGGLNTVSGPSATVGGGGENKATGAGATVAGGYGNTASGYRATVAGGEGNRAEGAYSFAAGYFSRAATHGSFVWTDSNSGEFASTAPHQFLIRAQGGVGIGTTNPQAALDVAGVTRTCTLTIYGGCDLAEPFPMKEEQIEKGAVVVIDEEHPGRLKLSTRAYDTQVAGIVSGANGINPGISLTQEGALDQGRNVALTGRVYVKADASHGAIKPGDLLTTSDTAGHAMKVSDHTKSQGAILGKAMSALREGTGLVLVLVTLQ